MYVIWVCMYMCMCIIMYRVEIFKILTTSGRPTEEMSSTMSGVCGYLRYVYVCMYVCIELKSLDFDDFD